MRKLLGLLVAVVVLTAAGSKAFAQQTYQAEVTFLTTATVFGVQMFKMQPANNIPALGDSAVTKIVWGAAGVDSFAKPIKGSTTWVNSKVYVKFDDGIEITTGTTIRFYTKNMGASGQYKYNASISTTSPSPLAALDANNTALNEAGLPLSYMVTASTEITNVGTLDLGTTYFGPNDYRFATGVWAVKDQHDGTFLNTPGFSGVNLKYNIPAEYSTIATADGIRYAYGDIGAGDPAVWYDFKSLPTYMFFASTFETAKSNRKYGTDSLIVETVTQP